MADELPRPYELRVQARRNRETALRQPDPEAGNTYVLLAKECDKLAAQIEADARSRAPERDLA